MYAFWGKYSKGANCLLVAPMDLDLNWNNNFACEDLTQNFIHNMI